MLTLHRAAGAKHITKYYPNMKSASLCYLSGLQMTGNVFIYSQCADCVLLQHKVDYGASEAYIVVSH